MLNSQKREIKKSYRSLNAFTFIELLLVMAIIAVLSGIVTISLSNLVPRANLATTAEILTAELRQQQSRAMNREKDSNQQASEYGVYVEQHQYVLFSGTSYDANDSNNLITEVLPPLELNTNFPNQVVIFAKGSGEILNFNDNQNIINVVDTQGGQTKTIQLNAYGVPK